MTTAAKIGIIYLSFHSEPYIDDLVSSLIQTSYPKDKLELIIVDNPHPEHGLSTNAFNEKVLPLSGKELPRVTLLSQETNTGFAEGNNIGAEKAIELGCEYLLFHNNDGFFAANAFQPLVEAFEQDPTIGMVQSLVLLHPETNLVNTDGNCFHYLGFGYCDKYKAQYQDIDMSIRDIAYASGSGLMVSSELFQKFGGWDNDFFLYHEDLEWSFRIRSLGYRVVIQPKSVFFHKYQFKRSISKFYWMERNRYAVLLMYFKWPTLFVLLPMLLLMESGLTIFSIRGKWFKTRMRVLYYWTDPKHLMFWLKKRKNIQTLKKISDKELLANASSTIRFQEQEMNNWILLYIGNPLMEAYFNLVKAVVKW